MVECASQMLHTRVNKTFYLLICFVMSKGEMLMFYISLLFQESLIQSWMNGPVILSDGRWIRGSHRHTHTFIPRDVQSRRV